MPKHFRDNPFADPPPVDERDLRDGMFNLVNRGIIPRDVDISPAFERGKPALTHIPSKIFEMKPTKPKLSLTTSAKKSKP